MAYVTSIASIPSHITYSAISAPSVQNPVVVKSKKSKKSKKKSKKVTKRTLPWKR